MLITQTSSLFDTRNTWLFDPLEAFAAYVLQPDFSRNRRGLPQALRTSSVVVYRARWGKFVRSCLENSEKTLATLETGDLQVFLDQMSPSSCHRYVRLLERVFDHLAQLGITSGNPVRALAITAPTRSNQGHARTAVLSPDLQAAFLAALPEPVNWKRQRDRALISLILGAGLRVAEAIKFTEGQLGMLQDDGTLPVEIYSTGAGRRHRTRLQAFAVEEVQRWRDRRLELVVLPGRERIPGRLLFPAGAGGQELHPTTVYRRVASVLATAGIPEAAIQRRGARTLRSTYAVRELAQGASISLVGESMGHVNDKATRHYLTISRLVHGTM